MKRYMYVLCLAVLISAAARAQTDTTIMVRQVLPDMEIIDTVRTIRETHPLPDSLTHFIPIVLPKELFIPDEQLEGMLPWTYAPITRPAAHIIPVYGYAGIIGAGQFGVEHYDRFFSTLFGYNLIDIPQLFRSQQMLLGNTLRLGKNVYFTSGIMYGAQMGVRGNNWGMGTREGIIWRPSETLAFMIWDQYFQSVTVYTPILFRTADGSTAAIVMPATPEVFSFGVQASFTAGEFLIDIGASVSPTPFQRRHHSKFRIK